MSIEYEWKESKHELPPLGEVIEAVNPKNWIYSKLGRDYFALVEVNNKLIWITPSLIDMDYKELKITHWRHIPPDPKGKNPFVKIKKAKGYWEAKVFFKNIEKE